jgi:hypothetical protein
LASLEDTCPTQSMLCEVQPPVHLRFANSYRVTFHAHGRILGLSRVLWNRFRTRQSQAK